MESKRPRHEEKVAPRRILRSRFTAHTLHYIGGRGVHGRGTRRHCTAVKCILSLAHLWPLSGSQCPLLVFIIQPVQRGADLRLLSAALVNEPLRDFSMGPSVFLRLCCVSPSSRRDSVSQPWYSSFTFMAIVARVPSSRFWIGYRISCDVVEIATLDTHVRIFQPDEIFLTSCAWISLVFQATFQSLFSVRYFLGFLCRIRLFHMYDGFFYIYLYSYTLNANVSLKAWNPLKFDTSREK